MTPGQEAELVGGGDCFAHWHSEDRRPTHDFLRGLQTTESAITVFVDTALRGAEDIVLADTNAGNIALTLFRPVHGLVVTVIKVSALNTLTVEGKVLSANNSVLVFKAINDQWFVIGGYTP